jgi:hypothetical protein
MNWKASLLCSRNESFNNVLQAPKNTPDEVAAAASSCFKLNSLQLRCLLMKYSYESDEVPIAPEILENVVRVSIVSCLEYYDLVIARMSLIRSKQEGS